MNKKIFFSLVVLGFTAFAQNEHQMDRHANAVMLSQSLSATATQDAERSHTQVKITQVNVGTLIETNLPNEITQKSHTQGSYTLKVERVTLKVNKLHAHGGRNDAPYLKAFKVPGIKVVLTDEKSKAAILTEEIVIESKE